MNVGQRFVAGQFGHGWRFWIFEHCRHARAREKFDGCMILHLARWPN
jgi:hypothetical protein